MRNMRDEVTLSVARGNLGEDYQKQETESYSQTYSRIDKIQLVRLEDQQARGELGRLTKKEMFRPRKK